MTNSNSQNQVTTDLIPDILQLKLWKAATDGDTAVIRLLAMHGVDLDARNERGETAFMLATRHNHVGTAKAIVAAREYQYLQKVGTTLERVGHLRPATVWHHMPA